MNELKVYKPSESLMQLATQIRTVAGFDPGLMPIFERATKINAVNALLSHPDMADILDKLEGSSAGFSTDLAAKGEKYEPKVRNAAVTQALSLGAQLVNKEFGIIKGGMMLQKNYFQRTLDTLGHDGTFTASCKYRLMWWDTENGEISLNGNMATIPMTVKYKLVDKETGLELDEKVFSRTIQLKTYPSDGPDMWLGKAERRVWQKLLRYLSGIDFGEDSADESPALSTAIAPPVGMMSLKKDAPAAVDKPIPPTAEDAQFKDIVAGKPPSAAPVSAPVETTSKTQTKPYAEMTPAEKKAETEKAHSNSLAKTIEEKQNKARAEAFAPKPVTAKPELF